MTGLKHDQPRHGHWQLHSVILLGALLVAVLVVPIDPLDPRVPPPVVGAEPPTDPTLQQIVEAHARAGGARFGVAIRNLATGQTAYLNAEEVFAAASLYKLAVLYTAYADAWAGRLDLDETLTVTAYTLREDDEPTLGEGDRVSVREALGRMITWSDNTAAYLLLDRLGWSHVNAAMAGLGLPHTRVGSPGATTRPVEVASLLERVAFQQAVAPGASAEMLDLLLDQQVVDRLPALLPSGVRVAHKTGNLPGIRHDAGIVFGPRGTYVIVIMADGVDDPDATTMRIAELSSAVYDYFTAGAIVVPPEPATEAASAP
ncbi:MAG: serine hydrolase [Chloroflexi bacterium]|nr:serine hydrolase [Chloroflexota bacterium]